MLFSLLTRRQCCGYGSGGIRTFLVEFVSESSGTAAADPGLKKLTHYSQFLCKNYECIETHVCYFREYAIFIVSRKVFPWIPRGDHRVYGQRWI
jgi:hypothetical protein